MAESEWSLRSDMHRARICGQGQHDWGEGAVRTQVRTKCTPASCSAGSNPLAFFTDRAVMTAPKTRDEAFTLEQTSVNPDRLEPFALAWRALISTATSLNAFLTRPGMMRTAATRDGVIGPSKSQSTQRQQKNKKNFRSLNLLIAHFHPSFRPNPHHLRLTTA